MRKKQFNTLVIHDLEEDIFHLPNHSHTYYELVYIVKGKGKHYLNNIVTNYTSGDLFLISPDDEHYFEFDVLSRMIFIKFTDQYFESQNLISQRFDINPEKIMRNKMLKERKLLFDKKSKVVLKRIVETILDYDVMCDISNSNIIFYQLYSLFCLIEETAFKMNINHNNHPLNKKDIITYLHQNIYNPDKLRVSNLASNFNISQTYFSNYFKRNFEISLRDYINLYRLELLEHRIKHSDFSIKQMVDEFGFSDASHLSHFFKKHKNYTISSLKSKNNEV